MIYGFLENISISFTKFDYIFIFPNISDSNKKHLLKI